MGKIVQLFSFIDKNLAFEAIRFSSCLLCLPTFILWGTHFKRKIGVSEKKRLELIPTYVKVSFFSGNNYLVLGSSKRFSSSRLFSMGNASVECSLKIFTYVRVCAYKVLLLRYVYGDVVLYKYLYAHTQVQAAICHDEIAGGLNPRHFTAFYI